MDSKHTNFQNTVFKKNTKPSLYSDNTHNICLKVKKINYIKFTTYV